MRNAWALGLVVVLAVGCGRTDAHILNPKGTPPPKAPPAAVLRVVCEQEGTRVLSSQVRARPDGIHVEFLNRAGMNGFYMRSTESEENHGGRLRGRIQKDVSSHAPGTMQVACHERGDHPDFYGDDARYAQFEIVDPDDLWIPWTVACDRPETLESERVEGARSAMDVERWLRDRFDVPAEAVRMRPGYPDTQWKGDPWVLRHEDETIVYFHAFQEAGAWRIESAEVCT